MMQFVGSHLVTNHARGAVVAIGNFDGLHRGHQALFAAARARAHSLGTLAGVLTFDPHPVRVLAPHLAPPLILTADEKQAGIAAAGIDLLVIEPFTLDLARSSPERFVEDILVDALGVRGVVVGPDFSFGHHAKGKVDDLARLLAPHGVDVDIVPAVREGDLVCSSSRIRQFVLEGRVDAAGLLLGRPYWLAGEVVHGEGRGRTLQIPTANVAARRELLPKIGVYATRAILDDGSVFASVTNVGLRPTFDGQGVRIEAHLLGFDGDLYGRQLRLDFVARIRDEKRFANVDALRARIAEDIAAARAILGG